MRPAQQDTTSLSRRADRHGTHCKPPPCGRGRVPFKESRAIRCVAVLVAAITTVGIHTATARSAETSREAQRWHAPPGFIRQALCIHRNESTDWYRAWTDWRGRPSVYAGGLQFTQSTWERAGGRGEPWQWSPREQVYRAWRIWLRNGGSWVEWGTRGACGLR